MRDVSPRLSRSQRCQPGVAEEVQHLDWPSRGLDQVAHPIPMVGLLGEDAHMAERCGLCPEAESLVLHRPALRKRSSEMPAPIVLVVATLEYGVGCRPLALGQHRLPDRLWLRPDEGVRSE